MSAQQCCCSNLFSDYGLRWRFFLECSYLTCTQTLPSPNLMRKQWEKWGLTPNKYSVKIKIRGYFENRKYKEHNWDFLRSSSEKNDPAKAFNEMLKKEKRKQYVILLLLTSTELEIMSCTEHLPIDLSGKLRPLEMIQKRGHGLNYLAD